MMTRWRMVELEASRRPRPPRRGRPAWTRKTKEVMRRQETGGRRQEATRTVTVSPSARRTETFLTVLSLGQLSRTSREVRDNTNTASQVDNNTTHGQSDSLERLVDVEMRENKERQSSQVEEINNPVRESHSLYLVVRCMYSGEIPTEQCSI